MLENCNFLSTRLIEQFVIGSNSSLQNKVRSNSSRASSLVFSRRAELELNYSAWLEPITHLVTLIADKV
ncbi:hypothetical protein CCACVL1_04241 [Corchorus capsularis]|uniref:Uncharacterized protein n=1 Tax=Corchorus capsularis TaxID=210143 RepID=A0A1R3JUC4_COCAP|nr:hypothetical protein CCACVL1_04241 [Corchorus capsularis]